MARRGFRFAEFMARTCEMKMKGTYYDPHVKYVDKMYRYEI